jgi:predicted RNA-binding Zn ribbon-like protein
VVVADWFPFLTALLTAASAIAAVIVTNNYNTKRDQEHHRWQVEQEKLNFERAARAERRAQLRKEYGAMMEAATRIRVALGEYWDSRVEGPSDFSPPIEELLREFRQAYAVLRVEAGAIGVVRAADNYSSASGQAFTDISMYGPDGTKYRGGFAIAFDSLQREVQEHLLKFEVAE